jgi:hypothetical protein
MPLAKRLQRKELIRGVAVVAGALLFLAACHRDGLDAASSSCPGAAALPAAFQAVTVSSDKLGSCLTLPGNGATYLVVGQFASVGDPLNIVNFELGSASAANASAALTRVSPSVHDNPIQRRFESTLRGIERTVAPSARAQLLAAQFATTPPSAAISAPPAIGSTRDFKVVAALDGSSFTTATGRLIYAGTHVLLYADTIGQGFSDAQYQSYGALFDKDLYAIDVNAFGAESDVDQNGRVIAFFTPKINALVNPSGCIFGYVTGFFYAPDLLVSGANSNKAEIFYSYVPDSTGNFGCAHTTASVQQMLPGTFLHELQHMISYNQHVLVRGGAPEDMWLNEGLGQIAEELGSEYYEAKFPPPTGRSTTTQIFPDSAGPFIQPQLLDTYVYLGVTRAHSVTSYNGGGSLEERGATWLFLHWLGSQKGEGIFKRLVQTTNTGVANIEAEAGEKFGALFGDFSTAIVVDSIPGVPRSSVPARFRFGNRNLRLLMAREAVVEEVAEPWPLPVYTMGASGKLSGNMIIGTMVHASFTSTAGGPATTLSFTAPNALLFPLTLGAQVTVFRLPP